jgi:hypothetical protein
VKWYSNCVFVREIFFLLSAGTCPEMESVSRKLILVFSIIHEPFGSADKGLRESRGIGCELAAGVDIYYSKGGLPPFPNRREVCVVCTVTCFRLSVQLGSLSLPRFVFRHGWLLMNGKRTSNKYSRLKHRFFFVS